ncbi:MAG: tetratricopeptide repeat protein [Gammaproteobacteria bacterium]
MSKKKKRSARSPKPATQNVAATAPATRRRLPIVPALLLVIAAAILLGLWWSTRTSDSPAIEVTQRAAPPSTGASSKSAAPKASLPPAEYVGRKVCAECHQQEDRLWRGSHHDLAMQEANTATVLGDFSDETFDYYGTTSRFYQRDGTFFVNTDGPDGRLADYAIKYTFGVSPLQQYLVEFPGGRLQALPLAWDTRTVEVGGQRWFHLYPDERIDHTDQLHWSGQYQNWNLQCAACHSTNLTKGYDAASNSYDTRFSELNVSCEACHGPGSRHAEWAAETNPPYPGDAENGLVVQLHSRWNEAWKFSAADAGIARRDSLAHAAVINVCAACHARRSTITETVTPGAPLADSHRLALLTPPQYHPDGQIRDEVYVWGSFLQSRMHQQGVTCMDCHEPHTAELRVQGNALCSRCHEAGKFDSAQHHFHEPGSPGAQCVNCHMPTQNYMVIDARRDHSIRLPRPDLSQTLGSPNACNQCHTELDSAWAATSLDSWYGPGWRERPHYGSTLHAAATEGFRAAPDLLQLAQDMSMPALVRATATSLLQPYMRPQLLAQARALLKDAEPEVRIAALGLVELADPANLVLAAAPLLEDPVRGVRVEAARILAAIPDDQFPARRRDALAAALNEYVTSLQQNADWPAANASLGNLYSRQGHADRAIEAYRRALELDPLFVGAYVNLAETYRTQGRDDEGEAVLLRGLEQLPEASDLHHALGLLQVRQGDTAAAVDELKLAARLAPDVVRYTYVYAIALHSTGRVDEALAVLSDADARYPNTPDILGTLVSIYREAGDNREALVYAQKLASALPGNPEVQRLIEDLKAGQ